MTNSAPGVGLGSSVEAMLVTYMSGPRTRRGAAPAALILVMLICAISPAHVRDARAQGEEPQSLTLRQGDYVTATVSPGSDLVLRVVQPDGQPLRTWRVGAAPTPIAFVTTVDGVHRLEFVRGSRTTVDGPVEQPARVTNVSVSSLDARLRPRVADRSVLMQDLRRRVAAGEWRPASFWSTVASRGTPIVEQSDDERYQLVTFLWRARGETRNVSVIGTFMKAPFAEPLEHLTGTDIWYRTFRIPAGARFSYFLSANSPLAFDGPDAAQQMATLQADPRNPNRWMSAPEADVFQCQSRVELLGAASQPWSTPRETSPKGTLEKRQLASPSLGQTRDVLRAKGYLVTFAQFTGGHD